MRTTHERYVQIDEQFNGQGTAVDGFQETIRQVQLRKERRRIEFGACNFKFGNHQPKPETRGEPCKNTVIVSMRFVTAGRYN